jgi:hypothetical protein
MSRFKKGLRINEQEKSNGDADRNTVNPLRDFIGARGDHP